MGTEAAVAQSATEAMVKTKQVKKTKTKAKTKASEDIDLLVQVAHEVENLSVQEAFAQVESLLETEGDNDFRLGGVLAVIQSHGWLENYANFRELIEQRFGLHYRKAMYLIGNYTTLVDQNIPWDKVKHIGWTKLREITRVINQKNIDKWVALAEKHSVAELKELVRAELYKQQVKAAGGDAEQVPMKSAMKKLTFSMHDDQYSTVVEALKDIKEEVKTEFDSVALYNLCLGYLGGSVKSAKVVSPAMLLQESMMKMGYMEVLEVFEKVFPTVELWVNPSAEEGAKQG